MRYNFANWFMTFFLGISIIGMTAAFTLPKFQNNTLAVIGSGFLFAWTFCWLIIQNPESKFAKVIKSC